MESAARATLDAGLTGSVAPGRSSGDNPLDIALICPYSLSRPGGVQGQVVGLARVLGVRGHRVTVFAPLDREEDAPEGIDLVATGHATPLPANGSVAPVSLSVATTARARRLLVSRQFDVVHVHEPFAPGLPFALLLGTGVPPLVATFHRSGGSALYTAFGPVVRRLASRFAVRCAVSEAAQATAEAALGAPCLVGFNGIEVERYDRVDPWPALRPTVLFLGRHEERKGLQVLLEAFDQVGKRPGLTSFEDSGPPVLWIAGDGPLTEQLRHRYRGSTAIEWLGVLSESEKDRRLVAADVLCAPSLGGESFGMVLVEGMAARTVVVASDIPGYRAAAGGSVVLVPPGDAPALAAGLLGVLAGRSAVTGSTTEAGPAATAEGRRRWLDIGGARAAAWSMDALADWYEGHYRGAVVSPRG